VTGILDWEQAQLGDPPQLDIVQFLLSVRMLVQRQELGDVVRDLLDEHTWSEQELHLLKRAQESLPGDPLDSRTLLLLAWLRHVTDNLRKSTHYATQWLWTAKNIERVLLCV
jgi:hypothetical protein